MTPRINYSYSSYSFLIFISLLVILSSGTVEGSGVATNQAVNVVFLDKSNSRKALGFDAMLDYDYAGPNKKHDPRGKNGGNGSKTP